MGSSQTNLDSQIISINILIAFEKNVTISPSLGQFHR